MRTLVLGAGGRVGRALVSHLRRLGHEANGLTRLECDATNARVVGEIICDAQPELVLNCVANNNSNYCENNPQEAFATNSLSAQNISLAARKVDAGVVYFSGNVVFGGWGQGSPTSFAEYDPPNPKSIFAKSKYAGECITRDLTERHFVVRTAWLFGDPQRPSLVDHIRQKLASGETMTMASDIWANPTCVKDLVSAVGKLIDTSAYGIYHAINEGVATPYELAEAVSEFSGLSGSIEKTLVSTQGSPLTSGSTGMSSYLLAGVVSESMRSWRHALSEYLANTVEDRP